MAASASPAYRSQVSNTQVLILLFVFIIVVVVLAGSLDAIILDVIMCTRHLGFLGLGSLELCTGLTFPRQDASLSIELPTQANETWGYIDPDFPGFAFEQASLNEYATDRDGNVNEFSTNLIKEITSRTGGKPLIRIGGTSADYGRYLPGQEAPALPKAEVDNYQDVGHTTIGPNYWELCKNWPDALYIIQSPLAITNVSETIAWVESAVNIIGIDQIHSIQPGNEPNLYNDQMRGEGGIYLGPPEYQGTLSNETYTGNFTKYVAAIKDAVPLPDEPFFQAFDIGTHFDGEVEVESWIFDVETNFNLGIDAENDIKTVAHHYYQNQAGEAADLDTGLMDMSVTHYHLDQFRRRINWLHENRPDIPFILSEVGNSLQPTHSYEYQARLGSALWQVDFCLYSLAIGVVRINYQQIMHAGYNLWLPVESAGMPAQVFSNYYSQPFIADFIGSSGKATMQKVDVVNGDTSRLSAYVAFEDGVLKRVAIVNTNYWNASSSDFERPAVSIDLKVPDGVSSVRVEHLNSPDGAGSGAETVTYAGSQWTFESLGKEVKGVRNDTETVTVENGVARISVLSSEAVLVWF